MKQNHLSQLLLDQSKDLIWMINPAFQLVYANKAFLNLMKEVTGVEKKLNESALVEGFGEGYIEKWKGYYKRALKGEYFEIEEHYLHPETNEIQYSQITFEPLTGDDNKIFAIACQSKDVTLLVKQSETNQMIDSSFDVFCTINEKGIFVKVSAAAATHWGYSPEELIGKPYQNFILEEDVPKTNETAANIIGGRIAKSFVNRYKKKNGDIAYNLWSARWDESAKLLYCVVRDAKEIIESEEILHNSEQRFKALVQEGSDLIGILDEEGNYLYVSPTSISVLGMAPEEFIGRNAFEFIHPDDAERVLASLQKISTENKVMVEPFRFQNHKKEWRWVETVLTNMLGNPAVNGIVSNSRDITQAVNARRQTEENELFNRTVLESSPDCLKVLDNEGRIQFMNFNGLCQMEIDDFSIFKNKNWWSLWGSENKALVKESLNKALKGENVQFVAFCCTAKGTPKWWDVMVSPVGNPDEPVQQIISVSRDITKQKEEEQRLKLLESVITNTNDAILITEAEPQDEPGPKIIYVNEAFTKMTGYTAEEVIGKSPRILQGPNSNKEELAKLGRALRNWKPYEITTVNYKKNGEEFWINFTVTPVANEKGWYTHWIAIERDVSEQKNKELEKDLINKISDIFNQNIDNDLMACGSGVCEQLTKFGDFDFTEMWLPAIDNKTINCAAIYFEGEAGNVFYDTAKNLDSLALEEGIPGYIRKNKATEIWDDGDEEWHLLKRKVAAKKAGIKSMISVPLTHKGEFVGALLIGTEKTKSALGLHLELFQKLESTIGAELSRKKIEIELAQIFNFTPDMICVAGFDGYIKRINPAGLELLGYSLEEMRSRPIRSFIHEDDRELTKEKQSELYNGGSLKNFENRYLTKDGKIVWLSWTSSSAPEHGIVYAVAKNITEEKKLRELNRQAGSLAKIGGWEVDLVNQSIFWSDEVHQMHETDPNSFVPNLESDIKFYREDFQQSVHQKMEKCIATGESFDFEAVLVTAKKKEIWVRAIGNAEFVDGICIRIYGSFQDINDRKESENRLLSISENLPGIVFQYIIHPDGTDSARYVSGAVEKLVGYTATEVVGNLNLLWDPIKVGGDYDEVKSSLLKSVQAKSKWTCRFKYVLPTGELRTYLGNGTPTFLTDGTILYNSIILDITQEAKNKDLLTQTTEIARIGSWEMDLINQDGDSMYWSPMMFKIVEVDDSYNPTLTGGIEFHIGESKERIKKALGLLIKDGTEFDEEILLLTAKGNERWNRAIGKSEIVNNKRTRIYGSYQDIDARKKSEEENRFNANLLSMIGQAAIATNLDGVVNYWNKAAENIYGWKQEEAIGKNIMQLITPETNKEQAKQIMEGLKNGQTWSGEFKVRKKDRTNFPALVTNAPIYDEYNVLSGIIGISSDITQEVKNKELLKRYTLELERSNEELEQFAFMASHDLQEPLRMIASFMDLLQRKYGEKLDEKGHQYIHFATDGAKRMKQIILDLLEYSRATRPTEVREEVDINDVLSEFKQLRRKLISEKSASINYSNLPILKTYRAAITQILHCLLDNALKYSKPGMAPKVEINAIENKKGWKFYIKDNGIGIDPQFYDKIFIIFQRLHNREQYAGTGIGLSIAKRHVEFLGGRIWVESTLGEGTIFYFDIPKMK